MNVLPLVALGAVFVLIVLGARYFTYKTMTERVCAKNPDSEYCRQHYQKDIEQTEGYKNCEFVFGETPNGGVKTVICYIDDKNKRVKKNDASKVMIRELDEKNRPVYETWTSMEEYSRQY